MLRGVEQSAEEGAIALERDAQLFCGDGASAVPLLLQRGTFVCEAFGDPLHDGDDEFVRFFDGAPWFIDESGLDVAPSGAQVAYLDGGE